jgi:hypothetical protein
MQLKPLDLLVCLELASADGAGRTYQEIGKAVGLSASEANQAASRAVRAGLLQTTGDRSDKPTPNFGALLEFLEHGVRYAFFAVPGGIVRGMPTAHSAPPLDALVQANAEPPLVWPDPEGTTRGQSIEPLYKTVPRAARTNPRLYELLALVDALRCGSVRDRRLAMQEIERRIPGAIRR